MLQATDQITATASAQAMGKGGCAFFSSTTPYTVATHPLASGFIPMSDTVFSALTGTGPAGFYEVDNTKRPNYHNYSGTAIGSITFLAGVYYPGTITGATISSGVILMYF